MSHSEISFLQKETCQTLLDSRFIIAIWQTFHKKQTIALMLFSAANTKWCLFFLKLHILLIPKTEVYRYFKPRFKYFLPSLHCNSLNAFPNVCKQRL
jgi:hypothetical protein